jgi:hypothetical protein
MIARNGKIFETGISKNDVIILKNYTILAGQVVEIYKKSDDTYRVILIGTIQ